MIRVFGSLNMDLVASVDHLPVPGETVLTANYLTVPGGKGNNQAIAAARAGGKVAMIGCVGQDGFGDRLIAALDGEGVDASGISRVGQPTGIAMITVDARGENIITVASGANLMLNAGLAPVSDWKTEDTLVVQMETPPDEVWTVVRQAREAGARTVVNVAPATNVPDTVLKFIDVLVVNEGEAMAVARGLRLTSPDIAATACALVEAGAGACVVTLGGDGAMAAIRGAAIRGAAMGTGSTGSSSEATEIVRTPPARVSVVDTTGAGDTFTGVLAQGLDAGMPLIDALTRASMAAGLACEGLGAQASMPKAAAIDDALEQGRI